MEFMEELEHLKIPLKEIKLATKNFSNENKLGMGGFGPVFKGKLRHTDVAVKRLDITQGQGEHEFLMEIALLASYKHDNLVSLIGFCDEGGEKILVYKHETRGSLDKHLSSTDLSWVQRLQVCLGAAKGLNYLHSGVGPNHRVIHRDIKSANVLLNENWEAKVSDFGLSKVGPSNQQFSFLVSHACGTLGYIDPVYLNKGLLTKESDVYSFGVVLLEVLCGRPAMIGNGKEERSLAKLAQLCIEEDKLDDIIIPNLRMQMERKALNGYATIAYQCLKENRNARPLMAVVVEELKKVLQLQLARSDSDCSQPNWSSSPSSLEQERSIKAQSNTAMDLFRNGKTIRLKSHDKKYLHAKHDQKSVSQDNLGSASSNIWTVEIVTHSPDTLVIRLKSCYGKYLKASNEHSLLGMAGRKVLQTSPSCLDSSVEWEINREGNQVTLKARNGQFLRANKGGLPPLRNSVTHDVSHIITKDWILWDVDIVAHSPTLKRQTQFTQCAYSFTSSESDSFTTNESISSDFSGEESDDSHHSASVRREEGREIHCTVIKDCVGDLDQNEEGFCFKFKGKGVYELIQKLEEETGLQNITVCSRNPLSGKLCPLQLQLPPINTSMRVFVVQNFM